MNWILLGEAETGDGGPSVEGMHDGVVAALALPPGSPATVPPGRRNHHVR